MLRRHTTPAVDSLLACSIRGQSEQSRVGFAMKEPRTQGRPRLTWKGSVLTFSSTQRMPPLNQTDQVAQVKGVAWYGHRRLVPYVFNKPPHSTLPFSACIDLLTGSLFALSASR